MASWWRAALAVALVVSAALVIGIRMTRTDPLPPPRETIVLRQEPSPTQSPGTTRPSPSDRSPKPDRASGTSPEVAIIDPDDLDDDDDDDGRDGDDDDPDPDD
jgi:hypothetical protein